MQTSAYVVHYRPAADPAAPEGLDDAIAAAGFTVLGTEEFSRPGRVGARVAVAGDDVAALRAAVSDAVEGIEGGSGAGAAVVPAALAAAPKLLLVMDVDSTLIKQEVIELLAAHAGKEEEVAAVTEAAMRGELDFAQSLHARVATLAGLHAGVIDQVRAAVELSEGARELVAAFHAAGHHVGVVSGGFRQVLDPLAAELGLDFARANDLGIEDGVLTGRVNGAVVDRAAKEDFLRQWAAGLGIPLEHTIAAGDGANDLDMVRAAGLGVAFNAKPALRTQADAAIDMPRLDIIGDLLGL
ncbi:hypothetical protein NCCP1664_05500 [Zafaria cholistanensis]|uniref:phosphoserine phosphatase n=1 Tax=Zafaria cholistanensis TaxID=1682741 RepID=A0A5A7NM69_9MICC|nr:phosphoserine phosphatase SerB [Zafaria cholistanensis]GER22053.1 hypothetical protein NCCP1664_05500 [Zafaria cholistanensis]